jgi:excisionase family DNA binding protein
MSRTRWNNAVGGRIELPMEGVMTVSHWSDLPLVLTSKQAAAILQLKPRTVANMLDRGDLRGVKIGKEWRVSRAELMRFVLGETDNRVQETAAALAEHTPAVIDKDGVLVIRAEPLGDLAEFIRQERDQRVTALLERAGV